jgi:hypothetical protein
VSVSGVDSVRMRVHLYERCFRRKPVSCVLIDEVHAVVTPTTPAAHSAVSRNASALGFPVDDERDRRCDFFDERIDEYALSVRCDVVRIGVEPCRTWLDRK